MRLRLVPILVLLVLLSRRRAGAGVRDRGQGGDHHGRPHRCGPVREERRRAHAAGLDEQADDRLHDLRPAQGREAEARRGGAGQRAGLEDGRLADVRRGRRAGEGRGPDPRHHHPVRQRRLRDHGRGDLGLRGGVRASDDRAGQGDRPDRQQLRQLHRPGCARASDDRARPRGAGARGSSPTSPSTSSITASASTSTPASSSRTAIRCCRRTCRASTA